MKKQQSTKLWGGRFSGKSKDFVDEFGASISFDVKLFEEDITLSKAHSKMLCKQKIITNIENKKICDGLDSILLDIKKNKIKFSYKTEDIHMSIETELTKRIGETAKKLHTARSRNDQIATDLRMYVKREIKTMKSMLSKLISTLEGIARKNKGTILPGYTHLKHAQPITLDKHMLAYVSMLKRDASRLDDVYKRTDVMPLGSGALAGVPYDIDRDFTKKELGFSKKTVNTLDAVSDRDFILEFLSTMSILMMHLSRFCEEYILWASEEFNFIEISDVYATGSSMMPNKKNPDMAELIRGKVGRVYGHLVAGFSILKNLPLTYNKDMQEVNEILLDSVKTVKDCVTIYEGMLKTTKFNKKEMLKKTDLGFMNATALADYLVNKGVTFRDAHSIVGKLVSYGISKNKTLEQISIEEYKTFSKKIEKDVYQVLDVKNIVKKSK